MELLDSLEKEQSNDSLDVSIEKELQEEQSKIKSELLGKSVELNNSNEVISDSVSEEEFTVGADLVYKMRNLNCEYCDEGPVKDICKISGNDKIMKFLTEENILNKKDFEDYIGNICNEYIESFDYNKRCDGILVDLDDLNDIIKLVVEFQSYIPDSDYERIGMFDEIGNYIIKVRNQKEDLLYV